MSRLARTLAHAAGSALAPLLLAFAPLALVPGSAAALSVTARAVAFVGDPAPGLPGESFAQLFGEVNAAGEVAFTGRLGSGPQGVWRWTPATGAPLPVLLPGAPSPLGPAGAEIAFPFARQITNAGQIGYEASLAIGPGGVTSATNRVIGTFDPSTGHALVARDGDPAPGVPGATLVLDVTPDAIPRWNDAGQVVQAIPALTPPFTVTRALYRFDPGAGLTPIYVSGDPVPGDPGRTLGGGVIHTINAAGEVAFAATTLAAPNTLGDDTLFGPDGMGGFYAIARVGGPALDVPPGATFDFFPGGGFLALNDAGRVAFAAELAAGAGGVTSADDSGIWIADGPGDITLAWREGDPVPGAPGLFFGLFDGVPALNDAGELAITTRLALGGTVTTLNDRILLVPDGAGSLALAAREGDPNPTLPGQVWGGGFAILAISDTGAVLFREIGGAGGYYLREPSGALALVAGPGVALDLGGGDVRTIASLLDARASDDGARLVGTASFTDGTSALVLITVPEPGAGLATGLGLVALAWARRRRRPAAAPLSAGASCT